MRFPMFGTSVAVAFVSMAALLGNAHVTSYAAPPPMNEGYPGASGEYEQSCVTANAVIRSGPGQKSHVIARLKRGDFGECRGSWCFVQAGGKPSGWVSERLIGRGENPYHDLGPGIPR